MQSSFQSKCTGKKCVSKWREITGIPQGDYICNLNKIKIFLQVVFIAFHTPITDVKETQNSDDLNK